MITGQMRTYEKCFNNILENLILSNNGYEFDIYILTEFYGKNGGTPKNKFINHTKDIIDFQNNIKNTYGHYLKSLIIESDSNKIDYPYYLNNYGPWLCLYKNKILYDSIECVSNYDVIIRMRPDVILSNKINLQSMTDQNTIYIVCGLHTRNNSWLHNRDWDHMCISNNKGMKIWNKYYEYLQYESPQSFPDEVRFNNKGFWINETNDKSIIATQMLFKKVIIENYKLHFDANNVFTTPIR
jgi:hypothetical protein